MRRILSALAVTSLVMAATVLPAYAHPHDDRSSLPDRIELPDGWLPEGITTDGKNLYSGSRADGAILKIGIRSGETHLFNGAPGRVAVGVDYDRRRDLLWVAGGDGKQVRAQDADTGEVLATYSFPSSADRFVNDLAVTRTGVYATDSMNKELLVVPFEKSRDKHGSHAALPSPSRARTLPLSGDFEMETGFNLNGIVGAGKKLVAVQSNTGLLFTIDPRSGATRRIDLGGATLVNGDGLELDGDVLYVVQNQDNQIAVVHLGKRLRTGRIVDVIERDEFAADVDVPTTVALAKGSLWAVNARFGVANPETASYWITRAEAFDD
jgi:sugar lactone lactonase YvrE